MLYIVWFLDGLFDWGGYGCCMLAIIGILFEILCQLQAKLEQRCFYGQD